MCFRLDLTADVLVPHCIGHFRCPAELRLQGFRGVEPFYSVPSVLVALVLVLGTVPALTLPSALRATTGIHA